MAEQKRVLVVDDASLVRMYYRDALERAGFHVEEALNGLEGLEKLLSAPIDLLIVDVNMPKMDGLSFLDAVRRNDASWSGIPAIVTSSEAGIKDKEAARAAGANFYLVKPVPQETLIEYASLICGIAP